MQEHGSADGETSLQFADWQLPKSGNRGIEIPPVMAGAFIHAEVAEKRFGFNAPSAFSAVNFLV
jgi:hypothetical protein